MVKRKIIVASHSGFCFGVKRALDIATKALNERTPVYSIGPIIHNPEVVENFRKRGLKSVKRPPKKKKERNITLLIPSHGISPKIFKEGEADYVDTTCPLVAKVHKAVKELRNKKYFIIIVGDKKHPEVKGLMGMAGTECRVLKYKREAAEFKLHNKRIALISQTTASPVNFREIVLEIARKDFDEFLIKNTICKNTIDRQKEAQRIASKSDMVLVVGGKNSANTSRLAELCRQINRNTYHIEEAGDLNKKLLKRRKRIGIVTGASTPTSTIRKIIERIRRFESNG